MKTRSFQSLVLTITAVVAVPFLSVNAMAQDSSTATTVGQAVPQLSLSYGVPQVLQLSRAKVDDSTIIAYIQNSGNNYGLDAAQIVYLKQQGVSSGVINTMLNQHTQPAQTTAQTATSQPASQDSYNAQTATVVTQPTVTYVQPAPSSTVYVIPDTQTYRYNDQFYYYPYNYSYYPYYGGWYYPPVSFSFGFGGGYRGGWGGGYHGGGGWHHH